MKLTVYVDGGFWYGLIEYHDQALGYQAFRYGFGKEPKEADIQYFISKKMNRWVARQSALGLIFNAEPESHLKTNPKRMQRAISKAKKKPLLSTKAQEALKQSHELVKKQKKAKSRQGRQQKLEHQFQLKQDKRRQKKKGH